jgi:hypothetical protein
VRQPFGLTTVQWLTAGWEKADTLGVALRLFLMLAERHGRNNGRGCYEGDENESDEQIVHDTDHPIHGYIGCAILENSRSR